MLPNCIADEDAYNFLCLLNKAVVTQSRRQSWLTRDELIDELCVSERNLQKLTSSLLLGKIAEVKGTYSEPFAVRRLLSDATEKSGAASLNDPVGELVKADEGILLKQIAQNEIDLDLSLRRSQRTRAQMLGIRLAELKTALSETRKGLIDPPDLTAGLKKSREGSYDVFISYRRDTGSQTARIIKLALENNYRVFMDVDTMPSGLFDVSLLETIENTKNFILVLGQGSFEEASASQDDWLLREIAHAVKTKRNIIPVVDANFSLQESQSLPTDIRNVVRHEAVTYSHEYFQAMIEKIERLLN